MPEPDDDASFRLAPGTRLADRYTIASPISRGRMGAVYAAKDGTMGRGVAIKSLLDRSGTTRFEIEARLLSQLDHPNVVSVVDHFNDREGYFLVMELVDGKDLNDILRSEGNPGLPLETVLAYTGQLCDALQYVHDQGIVHRDVKLHNVIRADRIVLVDFGVARELDRGGPGTVAVGTPRFMAPEVFAGGVASERSDVYSLGVTVWTLLVGSPPRFGEPVSLRALRPDASPELEQALVGAMELRSEERIPSVAAFARALDRPVRRRGVDLIASVSRPNRELLEGIVRTAANVFDAAAASLALCEPPDGELVYQAAWGDGAREILGVRLAPGEGIAGAAIRTREAVVVPECRRDPRFAQRVAARSGYIPNTMVVLPLVRGDRPVGVLSILDRRDGMPYTLADASKASHFASLALQVLHR